MALSNWLTRGEWNAAYFGAYVVVGSLDIDLSTHLRIGICYLTTSGYRNWKGIYVPELSKDATVEEFTSAVKDISKNESSKYGVGACTAEGDNSSCLAEIMQGTLDISKRARETLDWLSEHKEVDAPALKAFLEQITDKKSEKEQE